MTKIRALVLALGAGLAGCADQGAPLDPLAGTRASITAEDAGEGRYVVVFHAAQGSPKGFEERVAALGGRVEALLEPIGGAVVAGLDQAAAAGLAASDGVQSVGADRTFTLESRGREESEPEVEAELASDAAITSAAAPHTSLLYSWQWNMRAVGAEAAWRAGQLGSAQVTVAILDTGIDPSGPDLAGRVDLARSRSFVARDDSVMRVRFPTRPLVSDLEGHGTNVASQVASNGVVLAGVTSRTTLLAVRVCSVFAGACSDATTLQGILYAVQQGADVINLSLGGGFLKSECHGCRALYNRVLNYAHRKGVTVVVASGNTQSDLDHDGSFQANYCGLPNVLCVSATGPTADGGGAGPFPEPDAPASFSNFGRSVIDVAAPGGNAKTVRVPSGDSTVAVTTRSFVYSLCSRTKLVYNPATGALLPHNCSSRPTAVFLAGYQGTSQAAPHVAGLVALLVARHGRDPGLVRDVILGSVDDLGEPGTDPFYGKGRINIPRALGL
ncbi:MAG TPA: S8 family serine peptidase [Longimicrobium sp.]|jgi:subtilisin family serine protease